jgi:hypothetical protein
MDVASMRENRNTCRILVGKHEEKKPHERFKRGYEVNIRINREKITIGGCIQD